MKNAAEKTFHHEDDEEGVAEGAASLGADGGPVAGGQVAGGQVAEGQALAEVDNAFEDDAWLDEELTDEELAALGEEDFDEEELLKIDGEYKDDTDTPFSEEDFSDIELSNEELAAIEEDADIFAMDDFSSDTVKEIASDSVEEYASDDELLTPPIEPSEPSEPSVQPAPMSTDAEAVGALVAAGGGVLEAEGYGGELTDIGHVEVDHRPVPRISIHAFCETPQTTALIEKASVDRRISKAHLTMHMGGVAKAVDQFQTVATPNLIILETLAGGTEIFAQLAELAEVCDPSTKVVIIGQVNDIILYRELIRQGISEYIVRPHSPLQIIKAIADLYIDPAAPPIGRTLAFVGARGGVGSSTIAHNVAWCAAEDHQSDTVLLDLDLPFGTASLDFDQEASAGLYEALSSPERLDDVLLDRLLQKHTDHLSLFTAPSVLDRDYEVDDQAYETVIDVVRSTAPTVVVDVPHVWCGWSKRLLTTADEIVITATPDLAAFRNTKQLVDILNAARPNDAPPTLIINQFDSKLSPVRPEQFEEHVGLAPKQVFAWEPQIFGAAATNAAPIAEISPKSRTANAFRDLAGLLIGRNDSGIARPKFSFSGLFKKKR